MSEVQTTPEVLWAQRSSAADAAKNLVYLTISVPDVPPSSSKIDLKPTSLTFTGHSDSKKTTFHVELEFYAEIDVEESKKNHTAKNVEFVLRKKEAKAEYWPRLTKDKAKLHFLKTDFDKWVDEDEQDAAPEDSDYMGGMGGAAGMEGMGGVGGDGGFPGIDFSKLGGGGAGGMGGMDFSDMAKDVGGEEEEDDDSDDEMPGLEDEEDGTAAGESSKAAPKIQEIED